MLQPPQILEYCRRRYKSYLRSLVTQQSFFPLEIPFGRPRSSQGFEELHAQTKKLAEANMGYRIEWAVRKMRLLGEQRLPARIYFETESDYLSAINKHEEVQRFLVNIECTRSSLPELLSWVAEHPSHVIDYESSWKDLLKVCLYFKGNPKPGMYARELPVEVNTKFIECHRGILNSLLQMVLKIEVDLSGQQFEERFGLLTEPTLVRFRALDDEIATRLGFIANDLSVPIANAAEFRWRDLTIVISENKNTFLTLPLIPRTLAIWGGGAAAQNLCRLSWLEHCDVFYWGDIDVHGFHILSRLRSQFPRITAIMMDLATLRDCERLVVKASESRSEEVCNLNEIEKATYLLVKERNWLLEQEKIPHQYAVDRLSRMLEPIGPCSAHLAMVAGGASTT